MLNVLFVIITIIIIPPIIPGLLKIQKVDNLHYGEYNWYLKDGKSAATESESHVLIEAKIR